MLINLIKNLIVCIFSLFPLKKKMIIFESNSEIKDNSKALFLKCLEKKINEEYNIVWIVEDIALAKKKYGKYKNVQFIYKSKNHRSFSLKRMYYCCTAKYCFYTHLLIGLRKGKGQIKVFLTHGTPIKDTRGLFWNPYLNTNIICTSDFAASLRCKTFGGGKDISLNLGFPRNDYLFAKDVKIDNFLKKYSFKKLILWLPTFKHISFKNVNRNDFKFDTKNDISLLNNQALSKINIKLKEHSCLMIIKFHPSQNMDYVMKKSYSNILMMTNEELIQKNIDLYSLMGKSDALITDFSSVYMDYLLCDKPIGFELNDYDNFKNGRGFLVDNPLELMPGFKIFNENNFLKFIDDVCEEKDLYVNQRRKLCKKIHEHLDGNSSERILKYYGLIGDEKK